MFILTYVFCGTLHVIGQYRLIIRLKFSAERNSKLKLMCHGHDQFIVESSYNYLRKHRFESQTFASFSKIHLIGSIRQNLAEKAKFT